MSAGTPDRSALLAGITVVDLGTGMAPALAAKFLAECGARVVRPASAADAVFDTLYPAHRHWHRHAERSDEAADTLLAQADICIVGGEDHPDLLRRTDAAALVARHPALIVLDITGYPEGTAFAGRPATDILVQARSGLACEQFPDRPLAMAFEPCSYGAGLMGLIGTLAALYEREASGKGQVVTTSLFEGALAWTGIYWGEFERPTPAADFIIPRGVMPLIFRCRDGAYVHIVMGSAGSKYGVYQALGIDDPTVTPSDNGMVKAGVGDLKNFFGDHDLLAAHVARMDSAPLIDAIRARGVPVALVRAPGDCWDDEQTRVNGIIDTIEDGTRLVGLPLKARLSQASPVARPLSGRRPLDGVRVVDFGTFVAGPLASALLADLGADVVKVEAPAGEATRAIFRSFSVANRGKRTIALDMKAGEGRDIALKLCLGADIVTNNFRPGVSARLGVDPDSLLARRPDLIVLESPAYGTSGPLREQAGFDPAIQALTGHEQRGGGIGNAPLWNRTNMVDLAGAMIGAASMLAALVHRARNGNGAALETALVNAGIYILSDLVQHPDGAFAGAPFVNAERTGYRPAEAMYAAGDGWVAIVVRGTAAGRQLAGALGLDDRLPDDPLDWDEAAQQAIAQAVAVRTCDALQALFAGTAVWIEPCARDMEARTLHDRALIARGTVRSVEHAAFGRIDEVGALVAFSRSAVGNDRAAPTVGQHSREILREQALPDDVIDALIERRIVKAG